MTKKKGKAKKNLDAKESSTCRRAVGILGSHAPEWFDGEECKRCGAW